MQSHFQLATMYGLIEVVFGDFLFLTNILPWNVTVCIDPVMCSDWLWKAFPSGVKNQRYCVITGQRKLAWWCCLTYYRLPNYVLPQVLAEAKIETTALAQDCFLNMKAACCTDMWKSWYHPRNDADTLLWFFHTPIDVGRAAQAL